VDVHDTVAQFDREVREGWVIEIGVDHIAAASHEARFGRHRWTLVTIVGMVSTALEYFGWCRVDTVCKFEESRCHQ
jgi:hypothetical protein